MEANDPRPRQCRYSVDLAGEMVGVHLYLVAVMGRPTIQSTPITPPRRGGQTPRAHGIHLGALAGLALPHSGVDVAGLPGPVC